MSIFFSDFKRTANNIGYCWLAGKVELGDRYRRSKLGILWAAGSFLILFGVKLLVFNVIQDKPGADFGLYLMIGLGMFSLLNLSVLAGCHTLIRNNTYILCHDAPYTNYVLISQFAEYYRFFIIACIIFIYLLFYPPVISWAMLSLIPALAIYFLNSILFATVLGIICAKFRDVLVLIQSVMGIMIFATPVFWVPKPGTVLETVALYNPFAHYIALIRTPLLMGTVPTLSWMVVALITVFMVPIAIKTYDLSRARIPFWV